MNNASRFPIADLHCDTVMPMLRGYDIFQRNQHHHIDLPRLKDGGVYVQVFACSAHMIEQEESSHKHVNGQIDLLHTEFAKHPELIEICRTSADISNANCKGRVAAILAIEGGQALDKDPANIEYFCNKGIRISTIAHESPTSWCINHKEKNAGFDGLTDLGREMIAGMNRLGIIIDLSHSADSTVERVLEISTSPLIASHSNARALCGHRRNLPDEHIKAIAETGGLIGVTFVNNFLSESYNEAYEAFWKTVSDDELKRLLRLYASGMPDDEYQKALRSDFAHIIEGENSFQHLRTGINEIVDQIDYIVNLTGADHVGIGSDYDGISSTPIGLEDCSRLPNLTRELISRGYDDDAITKIMGGNFFRLFNSVCS